MADIRIKDLATTASSTASDDFLAVDGTTNGTRKLNAYSPTFGGNVVATGTLTVNSTTDSSSKDTGAIVTEGGLGVEKSATIGGNLTVSGTGAVTGNLNFGAKLVGNNDATNYYIGDSAGRLKINWYGGIDLVTETTTNNVKIPSTVASSSTTTGALIVSGGVGVAGAINAGGNLTVSGTGNSTIAGNLGMGATPSAWQSSIYRVVEFPNGVSLSGQVDAASMELATNAYINSSFLWTYKTTAEATRYRQNGGEHRFFVAPSGTAGTEPSFTQAATIKNNGNVLIGTTTDSGNGKLQLATHTTSAGGIGFGTDVSLHRVSGNTLATKFTSGTKTLFFYSDTNNVGFNDVADAGAGATGYYISPAGHTAFINTNGTTALTLDSSQNAEFKGTVTANATMTLKNGGSYVIADGSGNVLGRYYLTGGNSYLDYQGTLNMRASSGAGSVTSFDTSGNATFAGNIKTAAPSGGTAATWRLGTVATVSPTSPNRTIEVEIGGTTYYIHAKTTNN